MSTASAHRERPRSDLVPRPRRRALTRGRPVGRWLVRRWYDVRVHHPERFPPGGQVVVAANHVGFVDGPLLAVFAPRPVLTLTKIEMFAGRLGRILLLAGQIPLDRFRYDPRAIRTAVGVLRDGDAVGVFPEGTRGAGDFERIHRGTAYLALVTGAPVVPITFLGTREPGAGSGSLPPRGARIDIVVGDPIPVVAVPWPRTRSSVDALTGDLREQLAAGVRAALAETGRALPGPLPAGDIDE